MKDNTTLIHIVNGDLEDEHFLNIMSIMFKETEEDFSRKNSVSAFYKNLPSQNKPDSDIVGITLMSRYMSLGTLKSILDDVMYFNTKCYGDNLKSGYLKMYVFNSGNNAYEYRIDVSHNKYNIKFKGIEKDYKKVIKTNYNTNE